MGKRLFLGQEGHRRQTLLNSQKVNETWVTAERKNRGEWKGHNRTLRVGIPEAES